MNTKLRPEHRSTEGKFAEPGNNTSSVEEHDNALITQWFSDAAKAYGSGKEVAFALGCDPSFVTALKGGAKSVAGRYLVAMLRKPESAAVLLNAMCRFAGFASPKAPRKVSKQDAQRQLSLEVRAMGSVYEIARARAAAKLGTEESDLDAALDEVTGVHDFAAR
jgi:hypothetical protein